MRIFAFAHPDRANDHAVEIEINEKDFLRYLAQRDSETDLPPDANGEWVRVTDVEDGREWEIRTAPCGQVCRCAADARPAAKAAQK
jgi:hypothetical protein